MVAYKGKRNGGEKFPYMKDQSSVLRGGSFVPEKRLDKILHSWRYSKITPFVKEGMKVCDLGCGMRGEALKRIEYKISEGVGVDFIVDKSNEDGKIRLMAADLNMPIPLESRYADLVISMAVLEHLDNYRGFAAESFRILKEGGRIVLSTPSLAVHPIIKALSVFRLISKEEVDDHKRYFNKRLLTEIFEEAGFRNVKVGYFQLGFNQLLTATK